MAPHSQQSESLIDEAKTALDLGRLVAMPTETVYGLAAKINLPEAIKMVFQTKGRPSFDPLIVHVADIQQAKSLARSWPTTADILAHAFWPGPITLVVPKAPTVSDLISSGLDTVGIRIPNHMLALSLLRATKTPLAAPSANRFGKTSPTTADHVRSEFPEAILNGDILVLDGGSSQVGVESTVVKCNENEVLILRPGGITQTEIESAFQKSGHRFRVSTATQNAKAASPGHTEHHYMPSKPLTVFWGSHAEIEQHRALLGPEFKEIVLSDDSRIAARELYASLRMADTENGKTAIILYRKSTSKDLWEAIDDRLKRAASHRLGQIP